MEKEQVAVDEAVETVAEENTRAYSKTVWNESTPITADKLNKIEDGIASALPLTGGTLTGSISVPGESKFYNDAYTDPWHGEICSIKASGNVGIGGSLKVNGKLEVGQAIKSPLLEATTDIKVNRYGFTTYYTNSEEGTFIFCHKNSSSITLKDNRMVYANPQGNLEIGPRNSYHCHFFTDRPAIQFNKDLFVNENKVYHTGNKPTPSEIGAAASSHTHNYLPLTGGTVSGETVFTNYLSVKAWSGYGTGTAQMWYDGNTKLLNIQNAEGLKAGSHRVATWEGNPTHYMFRYGSGLGGAHGYITFSY